MKVIEPARPQRDAHHDQRMQRAHGRADQDCQDEAERHSAESAQCQHEVHRAVAVRDGNGVSMLSSTTLMETEMDSVSANAAIYSCEYCLANSL